MPETLYLAVNAVDRYLRTEMGRGLLRSKLQLVGAAALWTVSKYEEIYPIELRDAVYICDRAYSKEEVRESFFFSFLDGFFMDIGERCRYIRIYIYIY